MRLDQIAAAYRLFLANDVPLDVYLSLEISKIDNAWFLELQLNALQPLQRTYHNIERVEWSLGITGTTSHITEEQLSRAQYYQGKSTGSQPR